MTHTLLAFEASCARLVYNKEHHGRKEGLSRPQEYLELAPLQSHRLVGLVPPRVSFVLRAAGEDTV